MPREIKLGKKFFGEGQPAKVLPKTVLWVLLASFSLFLLAFMLGPMPSIFMLNHEKKQCSMMFGGGEGFQYEAPLPWQAAKPDKDGIIYTESGSCNVNDLYGHRISAEDCCQQLGYTYIANIEGIIEKKDYGFSIIMYLLMAIEFCFFWGSRLVALLSILGAIGVLIWIVYLLMKKYILNKKKNIGA